MIRVFLACFFLCSTAAQSATILQPQAPGIEPALAGRDDIIAWEGFESGDWWKASWWYDMVRGIPLSQRFTSAPSWESAQTSVTEADKVSGNSALRFEKAANTHYGMSAKIPLPSGTRNAFLRYYVKVPAGQAKPAGKDWGFHSGPEAAGTKPAGELLSVRSKLIETNSRGDVVTDGSGDRFKVAFYVYHMDQPGSYGETLYWTDAWVMKGEWACIEMQLAGNKVSSGNVANKDGILRGWINGNLKYERTNLRWFNGTRIDDIEDMDAFIYTGGSNVVPFNSYGYIDNVVIAKNRIGCYNDAKSDQAISIPVPKALLLKR